MRYPARPRNLRALLSIALLLACALQQRPASATKKSYVVYLGGHAHGRAGAALASCRARARSSHRALLGSVLRSEARARDAIFYSYTRYINGFAATLEEDEAAEVSRHPRVVSVFPNRGHPLHTTRSWEFLGMEEEGGRVRPGSIWAKARFGEGVVIGNLDTGVWPEAGSFRDDGMGPAPPGWRGICQDQQASDDAQVRCNRKLIGARFFNKGYLATVGRRQQQQEVNPASTRDTDGHGTHTLSTAAGRLVPGANLFGYGNGTAKGGAPAAHAAAYKVCWRPVNGSECFDADIIAAFDAAIHDGVHVLSVSLGGSPADYFRDGLAIGSFHAARHGVTVVCSAGNSGPGAGTVSNTAPWLLTVGASTMDREFPAYLVLDNNKRIKGQSLSRTRLPANKYYQLISSEEAKGANATVTQAKLCIGGSLDKAKVKGKIVVCVRGKNARVEKGEAVHRAGGAGMVLANDEASGNEVIADAHVLPATHITYADGVTLLAYLKATRLASGYITVPYTALDAKPAPFMAAFSSQGPNTVTPEILKPDITAPGVSILAAFTGEAGPTGLAFDDRRVLFNAESGTSMSCPHVAGIAGLLKAVHPDWSPAAIKSAIMTTGQHEEADEQLVLPPRDAVRLRRGARAAQPRRRPGPCLRRQHHGLPQLPLRAGLQLLGDRHVHGRRRRRPRGPRLPSPPEAGGPQLPVSRSAAPVPHRRRAHRDEEGEERRPRWRHVRREGPRAARRGGGRAAKAARVRRGGGGEAVHRHVQGQGRVLPAGGVRVWPAGVVGRTRQAPREEPLGGEGREHQEEAHFHSLTNSLRISCMVMS
uniref:Subtilisin-like protease SBT5.3 n=1 Tax=Zea mays TaxID=4577 RepID=A0A804UDX8_MAIZE